MTKKKTLLRFLFGEVTEEEMAGKKTIRGFFRYLFLGERIITQEEGERLAKKTALEI